MTSEPSQLSIRSDPDVQIAIFDATGRRQLIGAGDEGFVATGVVSVGLPRGLYRVRLERCGFVREHLIRHEASDARSLDGPVIESPAPLAVSDAPREHQEKARQLSIAGSESRPPLSSFGHPSARLFVFVRRVKPVASTIPMPGEPISLHDITGRLITTISPDNAVVHSDPETGYLAFSCLIDQGCYRLRTGHTRRDLAITIPAGRAALVFLADHGVISLRTARVYLPSAEHGFEPDGEIARAMESVLWALGRPEGQLPSIAHQLLAQPNAGDLSFEIACAHLAHRQGDDPLVDRITGSLGMRAAGLPDVEILARVRAALTGGWRSTAKLARPPLFHASLALALVHRLPIGWQTTLLEAAKVSHADSLWCTWSPRWWDERWIEPTIEQLRRGRHRGRADVEAIASSTRLPEQVVTHTLARIDARESRRESLFDRLAASGRPMPVREACEIVLQAVEELAAVHGRGRVHGNIHPGNVLIRRDGSVALDNSLEPARATEPDGDEARFGAPEVVLDPGAVNPGSDVWSMAATLYFLLTLEIPRERHADQTERDAARDDAVIPIGDRLPGLPAALVRCLDRALARNTRIRFRDGSELRDALAKALRAEPSLGEIRPSRSSRRTDRIGRSRQVPLRWIGVPAAAALAVLTVTAWILWYGPSERALEHERARIAVSRQLSSTFEDTGRRHLLDGFPLRALRYLVAAGKAEDGKLDAPLRMLFRAASRGRTLGPPFEHRDTVKSAAFSADGSRVVTASSDGTAVVWDVATGVQVATCAHRGVVVSAAFSPDGKRIVTASEDGTAQVWDAQSGQLLFPPLEHSDFVQRAVFSPDGKRIATASLDHTARIWSSERGVLERELRHRDAVWSVAFSPDGTRVATASVDKTARIWNLAGDPVAPPFEHGAAVWSAAFSADGARVVTASQDRTARIWDALTGAQITPRPLEHGDGVTSAAFDASGRYVVTTSYDSTARVWDASSGAPITPALEHGGSVTSAVFSPDGSRVMTASSDDNAYLWDARTGRVIPPLLEHTAPIASVAFSADGRRAVTASYDRTARVWDATGEKPAVPLPVASAFRPVFSRDGRRVLVASDDRTIRSWDPTSRELVGVALVHPLAVRTAAFSPGDDRIVTTSDDRAARIWSAATGQMLTLPLHHEGRVIGAAFSPDGARVVTVSDDDAAQRVRMWDAATGLPIPLSLERFDDITSAALNGGGTHLVTVNESQTARIWDLATGKIVAEQDGVSSAEFSPDGTRFVTVGEDRVARVWSVATGALVAPALEHHERVVTAAFDSAGERIVTVGDRAVRVWDAATGKPLSPRWLHDAPIVTAAFTADGERLMVADRHAVRAWDVSLDRRSLAEWSKAAETSPWILEDGVLIRRSLARDADRHDRRPHVPSS